MDFDQNDQRTTTLTPEGNHGAAVLQIASLRYDFNLKFDHTIRFQDIHLDEDATLILDLTTATQAYHGHRIGAFHNERRKKLPSWTGGVAPASGDGVVDRPAEKSR